MRNLLSRDGTVGLDDVRDYVRVFAALFFGVPRFHLRLVPADANLCKLSLVSSILYTTHIRPPSTRKDQQR